jgi:enoyl-CoA hydratase/carnithine racemase/3-hydroxyacyl-CoA dehydrogenase
MKQLRKSTLEGLGLGTVSDIFIKGKMPADTAEMVTRVFGPKGKRGALVISGANGVVGAGKAMQLGARLLPYGVPIVALDLPGSPDGITKQYAGLVRGMGREKANAIMNNIVRLNYDGQTLPDALKNYNPCFLLEAIPEKLELKKAHYALFKKDFPDIHIWSVTSGFPSAQLGVGIAHPAFPHEINKIWEIVEPAPSDTTRLLWAMGLIPMQVGDYWSFVLDVFFCGLTLAASRYHGHTNTPYWKTDKLIRKFIGPNPFRAHDTIGAAGANYLTWSCLHHLAAHYGPLFEPTADLAEHKDSGQNWYPLDHFRPLVNWKTEAEDEETLRIIILGSLVQMTSIMLKENRSDLTTMNALGEVCAQFTRGMLAMVREMGADEAVRLVKAYHEVHPEAAKTKWYPAVFKNMDSPEWQQLYVNAEHDGKTGVITISRESYNRDVDAELNRAITWLKKQKISRVIVTGDFHFSTQMVGADTNEFYPALKDVKEGFRIAKNWSKTARRLYEEFEISVGFIHGKRCMGGMLELLMHCHYLLAVEDAVVAMPEVTLPVVPGMEGCHWTLRKTASAQRLQMLQMLMDGKPAKAKEAVGTLLDYAGPLANALQLAREIVEKGASAMPMRKVQDTPLKGLSLKGIQLPPAPDAQTEDARKAIWNCVEASCKASLKAAIDIQAQHSAEFMLSKACQRGRVGTEAAKVMSA